MGEFVEQSLEGLLPVFEQLSHVHIFKKEEVTALVKQCRRFEYRIHKSLKNPDDFHFYADYLNDVLVLIKSRRSRNNYWHKLKVIDKSLIKKISGIYWACCERYPGYLIYWKKLFSFLDKHHMMRALSTAYNRALQFHGRDIDLRREVALWEFFTNASPDNARTQLQLALRMFPSEPRLFAALFSIELNFVDKVIQRRKFLEQKLDGNMGQQKLTDEEARYAIPIEDAVLDLKVAEIVMNAACKAVSNEQSGGMLLEMWRECCKCIDVPNIRRLQMEIENKLGELNNEDTRIMEIEIAVSKGKDIFDAYNEALEKTYTEKMHRLYLSFCEEPARADDPFSKDKGVYLIRSIILNGWAGPRDFEKAETSINISITDKGMEDFYKKAIEIFEQFNCAFNNVPSDSSYTIWELALDFTIQHAPNKIEKVTIIHYFKNFSLTFLYCSVELYSVIAVRELSSENPDHSIIRLAWDTAVLEHGTDSVAVWIGYANYAMKHHPTEVSSIYKVNSTT
uniref:U3 small nucleolar RNA-associated protein 6 homolog n=1 Tax=Heterorhabditis bacteriophora TaxID=37862 RepID=A0A1I7X670_HETBA